MTEMIRVTEKVDLDSAAITAAFEKAPIYERSGIVAAVRITKRDLQAGKYYSKDVWYDPQMDIYSICTYEMQDEADGTRTQVLKDTRVVHPGDWIITLSKERAADKEYNYVMPDAMFWRMFESTDYKGYFQTKGKARIIPNPTGRKVEVHLAAMGCAQVGDENCYFCAPCNNKRPDDLAEGRRYLISEDDFQNYWEPWSPPIILKQK